MLSKVLIITSCIFLLMTSVPSEAKEKDLTKKALTAMQDKLTDTDYLEMNYVQTISSSLRGKSRKIEGKAYFAAPKKFRWIKQKPLNEEIIYDGKTLIIYRVDDKTALKFNAATTQSKEIESISAIILDTRALLKSYNVKSAKLDEKTNVVSLVMTPKVSTGDLNEVSLEADLNKNFVSYVKLKYEDNKEWSFNFSNPKKNKIPDQRFKFTPQKDVKVNSVQ